MMTTSTPATAQAPKPRSCSRIHGPRWGPTGSACLTPREALRRPFHVDAASIVVRALERVATHHPVDPQASTKAIDLNRLSPGALP